MNRRNLLQTLFGLGAVGGALGLFYRYYRPQGSGLTQASKVAAGQFPVQLVNVAQEAGISFQHNSGAFGKKYLPETLGSGCAFLDYDNDGWLDILLVNSMDWPDHYRQRTTMK